MKPAKDSAEKISKQMRRLSIIFFIGSGILLIVSLIYEFVYKRQEGLIGIVLAIVGMQMAMQFYTTNRTVNANKDNRDVIVAAIKDSRDTITRELKEAIKDSKDATIHAIKDARNLILDRLPKK